MSDKYVLNADKSVSKMDDLTEWGRRFDLDERVVARSEFVDRTPSITVSTAFLGRDHRFFTEGPPLLFETMVFGEGRDGEYTKRCSTYMEAVEQHNRACELVRRGQFSSSGSSSSSASSDGASEGDAGAADGN